MTNREILEDKGTKYYIVHPGTGTIISADEVVFVGVAKNNITAQYALDADDPENLLLSADLKSEFAQMRPPLSWIELEKK